MVIMLSTQSVKAEVFPKATPLGFGEAGKKTVETYGKEQICFTFTTTNEECYYQLVGSVIAGGYRYFQVYTGPDTSYPKLLDKYVSNGGRGTWLLNVEKNHTYYVVVNSGSACQVCAEVDKIADDASNEFVGAAKVTNKKTKSGQIQTDSDVDFYRFKTAKKTTAYQFTAKNTSTADIRMTIYSRNDSASAITQVNNVYIAHNSTQKYWLNLKKNHTYYVKVIGGANATYKFDFTDSKTKLKTAQVKSFKVNGYYSYYRGGYTYLSWQNTGNFAGYELYRSTSKNGSYKKIKTLKNTSYYYDYGATRRHTNYYKIRYYVKDNGKVVGGKWSTIKSVYVR